MNRRFVVTYLVWLFAIPVAPAALAQSTTAKANPPYPVREMTMDNVRQIFGPPQRELAPVPATGTKLKPPITRWVYPDFIVYFERNRVIHTVVTHPREAPIPRT